MSTNKYANMNAWFTNIDDEEFIVKWDNREYRFAPGDTKLLPGWFAEHCAKHLTNKLLLKTGSPKMESYTSPKKPEDVPEFWNRFNKCFRVEGAKEEAAKRNELETQIELLNKGGKPIEPEPIKEEKQEDEEEDEEPKPAPSEEEFEDEEEGEKSDGKEDAKPEPTVEAKAPARKTIKKK